ncbi:hypothetical protein CEXT_305831 [Caerostris extrusa]|uniref:Uncharacterized protein n=1 Tax=Caerostris extrusa TaxID=172846 RepID=A0AAV4XZ65_CAEEX|nr:hypothetical protein CEXT_305831 [Caerostris extrusa]
MYGRIGNLIFNSSIMFTKFNLLNCLSKPEVCGNRRSSHLNSLTVGLGKRARCSPDHLCIWPPWTPSPPLIDNPAWVCRWRHFNSPPSCAANLLSFQLTSGKFPHNMSIQPPRSRLHLTTNLHGFT